jgi:nitrogen fixation protein NifB
MTIIPFPSQGAKKTTLILPVAQQPFCRIRFDHPDSSARAIPPAGALKWLEENLQQEAAITGVEISGPGDPLAEIAAPLETLEGIHRKYPELNLSLTTLGLQGEEYAKPLAAAGVTGVTLLVDAVSRDVADKLYAWIRPGKKTVPLSQAIPMLLEEQFRAAKAFKEAGCTVTIRSTVYPGINDDHIEEIARIMASCGAEKMQLVPYAWPADQEEQMLTPPDLELMQRVRDGAEKYLQTAIFAAKENRLGLACPSLLGTCKSTTAALKPSKKRPNIAVASLSGMEVDLHLGQAYHVLIYGPREDGLTCLLGTRPVPAPGSGSSRWTELAATLDDCFAILAASAGQNPRQILTEHGITVLITEGEIEGTVDQLFDGGKKKSKMR